MLFVQVLGKETEESATFELDLTSLRQVSHIGILHIASDFRMRNFVQKVINVYVLFSLILTSCVRSSLMCLSFFVFLDAQASLAPTQVSLSVRPSVGDTFVEVEV